MPAYDYRCKRCGQRFEKTQRITEPAGADCPSCGDGACERLITGGTFHLKGAGWYASDYGAAKPAAADTPAAPATAAATTTATEEPKGGGCGLPQCGTGACAAAADA